MCEITQIHAKARRMNSPTTGDFARLFGVKAWQVRRLDEDGTLRVTPGHGSYRAIPQESLAGITVILRDRGWLPADTSGDPV